MGEQMSGPEPVNQYPFVEKRESWPCGDHEKRISLTERSVTSMERTMEAVSTKLDLILAQITRVAILEEKHSTQQTDLNRAHSKIAELTGKHDTLAEEIRAFMNFTKGQNKVLWVLGTAVAGLFIKVLFFAANNGMTP